LWSAVGLSVALAIGMDNFLRLCDGAALMDDHFRTAPLAKNMPVLLAMLGIWQRNFMGAAAQAVLPYSERLRELPRYLQQLEMESNGKSVTRDGTSADYATAPVIFGECGTVGQHSFHQWLHQGSDIIPADFIGVAEDDSQAPDHHAALLANMAAQAAALAFGRAAAELPQDVYAGNRSSNILTLAKLDPEHLGMLLALYEHKTFVQGVIWNINSFDQPGVELGKKMAKALETQTAPQGRVETFTAALFRNLEGFAGN
ncbi:MAG: glucose-6-phosphate isomerase, partial [Pseudomonadota bacterium]|nr:glucose-6-phosphate isomerase [Pseudomonadota bacterium]